MSGGSRRAPPALLDLRRSGEEAGQAVLVALRENRVAPRAGGHFADAEHEMRRRGGVRHGDRIDGPETRHDRIRPHRTQTAHDHAVTQAAEHFHSHESTPVFRA
ncbi:hypothetical protein [Microbacterium sp. NPDC077057]|uniref:hypothetical protein n=1 Tax=unclassified Microbacterium TaxID=2609290 RepID=UPI003415A9EE